MNEISNQKLLDKKLDKGKDLKEIDGRTIKENTTGYRYLNHDHVLDPTNRSRLDSDEDLKALVNAAVKGINDHGIDEFIAFADEKIKPPAGVVSTSAASLNNRGGDTKTIKARNIT